MALSGLESGLRQGRLQGRKTGLGMASSRSGLISGRTNGIANKDKIQDPVLLASARNDCPYIYWNADNVTTSGGNVTAITNLLRTYNPLTQSANTVFTAQSDPAYISGAVFNNKAAIQFDTTDIIGLIGSGGADMTNTSEMTMIMVCKPVSTSRTVLFWKKDVNSDPAFSDTAGDLSVEFDGTNINVFFIGNPTTQTAQYRAIDSTIKNNWIILTVKARLSSPDGPGSFLDIFVNGKRCKTLVTDAITSLPRTPSLTWANNYIEFGNSSGGYGGNQIAAGFITEQWMNESEQLRVENYFRWYYGYNF